MRSEARDRTSASLVAIIARYASTDDSPCRYIRLLIRLGVKRKRW